MKKNEKLQNPVNPCYKSITVEGGGKPTLLVAFSRIKLLEGLNSLQNSLRKTAFTLAEVLITLGIIGIVAALTIPNLMQKYQEKVTVNKVKDFYSVMSRAVLFARGEYGDLDGWDVSVSDVHSKESAEKLMGYLKPYLKIARDCGTSGGCLQNGNIKYLNGDYWLNYDAAPVYYKLILMDGTYMWVRSSLGEYCKAPDGGMSDTCGVIWIDVNGKNSPNTIGKDIFTFMLVKNGVKPGNVADCKLNSYGWGCSKYILEKGNMDYLKQ